MNREGGSTLTIRKSNRVTDGFKGYKATLFAGERAYVEINIPLRGGDDLFLHGPRVSDDFMSEREQPAAEERESF